MLAKGKIYNQSGETKLVTMCPECGQGGTFDYIVQTNDILASDNSFRMGQRVCPNPECRLHVFYIMDMNGNFKTYPSIKIDFNTIDIPPGITNSFKEAITCHAEECNTASAIMIRRTLEELCKDRGANGKNLNERIKELKTKVILPEELFEALDDLRLLGNDAAHIESSTYDEIGEKEVEIGIELTKEILKACFQLKDLVQKLKNLKNDSV